MLSPGLRAAARKSAKARTYRATSAWFSRSLELTDDSARSTSVTELDGARARYFDALVEVKTGTTGAPSGDAERRLADAKMKYNDARRALGLELIE